MFEDSSLAAMVGALVGAVLLSAGTAVALNWRGWAVRYTDVVDALVPVTRRGMVVDRWPRLVVRNRIIFGGIALFGLALLYGAIAALVRR